MKATRGIALRASLTVLALGVLGGVIGWQRWQPGDPFRAEAVQDAPFTSLTYAYHVFLWWNPQATTHLEWTRQGNFSHVKQIFAWEDIQPGEDLWLWERADEILAMSEEMGVELVIRLSDAPGWAHPEIPGVKDEDYHDAPPTDLTLFGTYCGEVASRYAGRIDAYQVWNEPNLEREWGNQPPNAADYVALLAECSEAIRAADPAATIISAGLSPTGNDDAMARRDDLYLQDMYNAGFQQYVDVVGVHAPGFSDVEYGPDDAERDGQGRWATFRRVEDLRKIMIANDDAATQMAILEMGWTVADETHPEYSWFAVTPEKQAEQLVKAHEYIAENWRPWVGLVTTIYLADPNWTEADEQYYFAVTLPSLATRQAYFDLQNMAKYCGDRVIPARDPGSPEALGLVPTDPCD